MDSSSSTEGEGLSAIASATNEQRDAGRSAVGRRIKVRVHHRIAAAETQMNSIVGELKRAALENVTVKERAALIELVRHLLLV
jgi:hypothetical protein